MPKLYIVSPEGEKVYLRNHARTRCEMSCQLGSKAIKVKDHTYSIDQVFAEKATDAPLYIGMVVGAFCGCMIGPIGIVVGTLIGITGGLSEKMKIDDQANLFNGECS